MGRKEAIKKSEVFSPIQQETLPIDDSLVKQLKTVSTPIELNNEKDVLLKLGIRPKADQSPKAGRFVARF
ncbi:MAG: hypothetical protein CM1200mP16_05480 [Nitrospina sp.]|nr:MAG: hypothetical protein CM1200mP16_05480 [Nitrospina sp.]